MTNTWPQDTFGQQVNKYKCQKCVVRQTLDMIKKPQRSPIITLVTYSTVRIHFIFTLFNLHHWDNEEYTIYCM